MRRTITILCLCLTCISHLQAQLNAETLIDKYGAIRSDITKEACKIVGFKDEETIKLINNNSINDFKEALKKQEEWTQFYMIVNFSNKPLNGINIDKYNTKICDIRKNYELKLLEKYPDKRNDILNAFGKYITKISNLTEECILFNGDKGNNYKNYLDKYNNGRFVKLIETNGISQDENESTESKETIKEGQNNANPVQKGSQTTNNDPDNPANNITIQFDISHIKYLIYILALIALIVLTKKYLKYKKMAKTNVMIEQPKENTESKIDLNNDPEDTDNNKNDNCNLEKEPSVPTTNETDIESSKITPATDASSNPDALTPHEDPAPPVVPIPPIDKVDPPAPSPSQSQMNAFAEDADEWIIVGASVQGNGHIATNTPCQDNNKYEYLGNGWGIAITSDGAGSAKNSHVGSGIVVNRAMIHFKNLIKKEEWIKKDKLPTEVRWTKLSYQVLKLVHDELESFAKTKECDFKSLSATVIVVIHSPTGLLVTHVGDGRAGYKDMDGEWHSMITPHKGEEANQTIFLSSEFWNIPFYEMSGVMVPEARIIKEKVQAFTLMSDGCENTSWKFNQYNESTEKYYDPNLPFANFFDPILATFRSFRSKKVSLEKRKTKWHDFIKEGNKSFIKETDDKTMILAVLYKL